MDEDAPGPPVEADRRRRRARSAVRRVRMGDPCDRTGLARARHREAHNETAQDDASVPSGKVEAERQAARADPFPVTERRASRDARARRRGHRDEHDRDRDRGSKETRAQSCDQTLTLPTGRCAMQRAGRGLPVRETRPLFGSLAEFRRHSLNRPSETWPPTSTGLPLGQQGGSTRHLRWGEIIARSLT